MPPESKYIFETGRILEDVIFHSIRSTTPNSKWTKDNPIFHWIIDLTDKDVRGWFSKAERAELMSLAPPLPPRDPVFEYAIGRFPEVEPPSPLFPFVPLLTLHRFRNPLSSSGILQSPYSAPPVNPMCMPPIAMPRTAITLPSLCLFFPPSSDMPPVCRVCPV